MFNTLWNWGLLFPPQVFKLTAGRPENYKWWWLCTRKTFCKRVRDVKVIPGKETAKETVWGMSRLSLARRPPRRPCEGCQGYTWQGDRQGDRVRDVKVIPGKETAKETVWGMSRLSLARRLPRRLCEGCQGYPWQGDRQGDRVRDVKVIPGKETAMETVWGMSRLSLARRPPSNTTCWSVISVLTSLQQLKPRSHMNCNPSVTALRPKSASTTVRSKLPHFSCRSIGNQSAINLGPVGDQLAISGWELSIEIGDQSRTAWRLVGDWLPIRWRCAAIVWRMVADGLAMGWQMAGDLLKDGVQKSCRIVPESCHIITRNIHDVKCRRAIDGPFAQNNNALNNYT